MKVKIFISYHDQHTKIKTNVLRPIQTGCANSKKLFPGMLRDDRGDNISRKNARYNELTAQYWVWKHFFTDVGNPDFVGFMHYRRHFIFDGWQGDEKNQWLPHISVYKVPYVTSQYMKHLSLSHIKKVLENCDCVVLKPYNIRNLNSGARNIRERYLQLSSNNARSFDIFLNTAKALYPEYLPAISKVENGDTQYLCNMFVMNRLMFFEYCKFCFSILDEVDKNIDSSAYSGESVRFIGWLGEFCLSIFIFHMISLGKKVKELNGAYIEQDAPSYRAKMGKIWFYIMSKITRGETRKYYRALSRTHNA